MHSYRVATALDRLRNHETVRIQGTYFALAIQAAAEREGLRVFAESGGPGLWSLSLDDDPTQERTRAPR